MGIYYDTGNPLSETNDVIFNIDERRISKYIQMAETFAVELTLSRSFDGLYLFSFLLWLQTVILRDGFLKGKLSLRKTFLFFFKALRIERRLSVKRRLVWEFKMNFKKFLMLRYLLP